MRKYILSALLTVSMSLCATLLPAREVSGYRFEKNMNLEDFTGLDIGSSYRIQLVQGDSFEVTAHYNREEDGEGIQVSRKDGSLVLNHERRKLKEDILIRITMPRLEKLSLSERASLASSGRFVCEDLYITLQDDAVITALEAEGKFIDVTMDQYSRIENAGFDFIKGEYMIRDGSKASCDSDILETYATVGGTARLSLNASEMDSFHVQLSSSGRLEVSGGGCDEFYVTAVDLSKFDGTGFPMSEVEADLSGTARLILQMEDGGSIQAACKGLSEINYRGENISITSEGKKNGVIRMEE